MTSTRHVENDERKFCRQNSDLIDKAADFRRNSVIDITAGIECRALLKKHGIETASDLTDFVRQLPADSFPDTKKISPAAVKRMLAVFSLLCASLCACCLENSWIEQSVPVLLTLSAAAAAGLFAFGISELHSWLHYRRRRNRKQQLLRWLVILLVSFPAGLLVWSLHPDASIFTADTFYIAAFVLRTAVFAILAACLLRISCFPAAVKTFGIILQRSSLVKTGKNITAVCRLYPFRDEVFALCNHTRLIQILSRAQEKKTRVSEMTSRPVRIAPVEIKPVWPEPQKDTQPEIKRISKVPKEEMKEIRELYRLKEKHRATLDESSGSLMSTFVLKHKGSRVLWSLIDHGEKPVVFILNNEGSRNQLAEEVIAAVALFNPPELIEQIINDPLHNGLHFTGYENTVSVINDINLLWKKIHTSMADAARRQFVPGQSVDEINTALYGQQEDAGGFIRWKIVHFLEPFISVRMNDLQVSEDGHQYGFLPVFYFSEEEWDEDSEITEYLKSCEDLAVYSVTETGIANLNNEEEKS